MFLSRDVIFKEAVLSIGYLNLLLVLLPLFTMCFHLTLHFQSPFLLFLLSFPFLSILLTLLYLLMSFQILFTLIWTLLHLLLLFNLNLLLLLLPYLIYLLLESPLGLINLPHIFMIIIAI